MDSARAISYNQHTTAHPLVKGSAEKNGSKLPGRVKDKLHICLSISYFLFFSFPSIPAYHPLPFLSLLPPQFHHIQITRVCVYYFVAVIHVIFSWLECWCGLPSVNARKHIHSPAESWLSYGKWAFLRGN